MNLYLNCANNPYTLNKKNYLMKAADRLGLTILKEFHNSIRPEYVLNIEPYTNFIEGTKWTGLWEIDLLIDRAELNPSNWATADTIFVATAYIPKKCDGFIDKAHLLYLAADPTIHKRLDVKQEYDFVLTGDTVASLYAERIRCNEIMTKNFSYKNYGHGMSPEGYNQALNAARVQFVRSMGNKPEIGELPQRFFEGLMIGPVLTNYVEKDLPHIGLVEGVDYLSYRNDSEMLDKMKRLLEDENYRRWIADNGLKKALTYHTFEHRLMTVIEVAKQYE